MVKTTVEGLKKKFFGKKETSENLTENNAEPGSPVAD